MTWVIAGVAVWVGLYMALAPQRARRVLAAYYRWLIRIMPRAIKPFATLSKELALPESSIAPIRIVGIAFVGLGVMMILRST